MKQCAEQRAIICIHKELSVLKSIEESLIKGFSSQYVIESVLDFTEADKVLNNLRNISVIPAVIIIEEQLSMNEKELFIGFVRQISADCKVVFVKTLDQPQMLEYYVKGLDEKGLLQCSNKLVNTVEMAIALYEKDCHSRATISQLETSLEEKKRILKSMSKDMLVIDENYNVLICPSVNEKALKQHPKKCYEYLMNRHTPCDYCKALYAFEKNQPLTTEVSLPRGVSKLVTYYPVKNTTRGIVISMMDITTRKKRESMNETLYKMSQAAYGQDSVKDLYATAYALLKKELPLLYMCVAGKDFDAMFVEYLDGKDVLQSCKAHFELTRPYLYERMKMKEALEESGLAYEISRNISENYLEILFPLIKSRMLIMRFGQTYHFGEYELRFIKQLVEHLRIGIETIDKLKKITYQANHDMLTGLFNKDYFMKMIEGKLLTNRDVDYNVLRYCLAIIDLNYFKEINDTYGHVIGDEVLFAVAQNIKTVIRQSDLLARIGGDEFAILLSYENKEEIGVVLKRIQEVISAPIPVNDTMVNVGSSIGVVSEISNYIEAEKVIFDADVAMYEAKLNKSGSGTIKFFEKEVEDKIKLSREIEGKLNQALNNNEFKLQYQPIHHLDSRHVVGFEALLRWQSAVNSSPSEFLPIAEDAGYIYKISDSIFSDIIKAMKLLDQCFVNNNLFISVNMTSKQLMNRNYLEKLSQLDINFSRIVIEITEKSMLKNYAKAIAHIDFLSSLGIRVHLDDYGTGHTAISHLSSKGIDHVKIDRQLVGQLPDNKEVVAVVSSIIEVAHNLGKDVIAEGIETEEQIRLLKSLGCKLGQGYHMSIPMDLEQIIKFQADNDYKSINC